MKGVYMIPFFFRRKNTVYYQDKQYMIHDTYSDSLICKPSFSESYNMTIISDIKRH